jgi:putative two-component system hydrogenase maturation factor HypX/HoxX
VGPVSTAVAHPCDEVSLKGAVEAAHLHLIDPILVGLFEVDLRERAKRLARDPEFRSMLRKKHEKRLDDECVKPLASYRAEELAWMRVNFFGPDPAYHEARRHFVFKGNPPPQRSQLPIEAKAAEAAWILSKGTARAGMGVMSVF